MYPPSFEYYAPTTVEEAIGLLEQHQGEAKILAGGQSLVAMMKLRLVEPAALIDINRIPNLSYIREDDKFLRVGATARTNDLANSPLIRARYPILADAGAEIADPIVRNRGTVGGNLSHGDPGNDLPACMLALGAEFEVRGPKGARTVAARKFYQDTFVTLLSPTDLLTEVRIPKPGAGTGNAYSKMERKVGDFRDGGGRGSGRGRPGGSDRTGRDRPHQRRPHGDLRSRCLGLPAGEDRDRCRPREGRRARP